MLKKTAFTDEHLDDLYQVTLLLAKLLVYGFFNQLHQDHLHAMLVCKVAPLIVVSRIVEVGGQIHLANVINQIPQTFIFKENYHLFLVKQFVVYFRIVYVQSQKSENNFHQGQSECRELFNVFVVARLVLSVEHCS